jgi:IPT/TIG domain
MIVADVLGNGGAAMDQVVASSAPGSDQQKHGLGRYRLSRTGIFSYDIVVLTILALLGAWYVEFPETLKLNDPYKLAVESMWFGSLGGVIISLKGIYDHSAGPDGWDPSYNLWHLGRPLSGAVAGLMTVVLLQVVNSNGGLTKPVVYAAAFIFGTQERRFFNFLYEVARLIVQVPEEAKSGFVLTEIQPTEGSAGSVIVATGQGFERTATVKLGAAAVEKLVVSSDGTTAAGIIPARPLGADVVDVSVINAAGKSATLPAKFKFTA